MKIPLCIPSIGKEEEKLVIEVLRSGWLTHGPMNTKFEEMFAKYIGVDHAISLNSCTSGLHLSIEGSGISGEVIIPSFSWVASANAVVTAGATPVFADINIDDRALDIKHVESIITEKTEGIMLVHYGGQTGDLDAFKSLCDKKGLVLIEDSAETIGGQYKGKMAGSYGIGNYSFFPTKNITVGEGGMVTTNDADLAKRIRTLMAHGLNSSTYERESISKPWYKNASVAGYNFRMSNLLAAIGVCQMGKIDGLNDKRRAHSKYLSKELAHIDWITPPLELERRKHVYQTYSILLSDNLDRFQFVKYLNNAGIGASVHFDPPIHLHQYYKKNYPTKNLPNTEYVSSHIVSLPMFPDLKKSELDYMVTIINGYQY
jgi:perosamine synthetase